jgi:hypothetical protein
VTGVELHFEILPEAQREALLRVGPAAKELGFYLAGGTAVALRLGHRVSVDLDWFTDAQLEPLDLAARLREKLPDLAIEETGRGMLGGSLGGVRLAFIRYRYPLLAPLDDPGAFRIASMDDLVCMKLAAAAQRGEKKDLYDIAAICGTAHGLGEALALYRRKFDLAGSGHVVMSLAFFDDAEASPDPVAPGGATWPEVKRRLAEWVRALSEP